MKIGVLALQGNYAAHQFILSTLGVDSLAIRQPWQLDALDGLIIPGGESTALHKLMAPLNFSDAIRQFHAQGKTIFGTCAGMILLAKHVAPKQCSLGLIDITVERNAYGRQLDSFIAKGDWAPPNQTPQPCEMVFIRAPKVQIIGNNVIILAHNQQLATCVQQNNIIVTSFHPELTEQPTIHRYFLEQILPGKSI